MPTSQPVMQSRPTQTRTSPLPRRAAAPVLPAACLLPALATGAVLWACYHPLSWGWLAWGALVPLLCLVRSTAAPRRIYPSAWLGGLVFFFPVLSWMGSADQMPFPKWPMHGAWFFLAIYCALYFPAAIYLTR